MIFSQNNNPLVLVHKDMHAYNGGGMVDIMLTPQFYTLKLEDLDIKSHYRAKKLTKSILDGLLPESKEHEYFVYKEGNHWAYIAYNRDEILEFLSTKGLTSQQIGKVYFAQQAKDMFLQAILLKDQQALTALNAIVTIVPKALLSEHTRYRVFEESFRPKEGVVFGSNSSLIGVNDAYKIAAILIGFGGIYILQGSRDHFAAANLAEQSERLFEEYPTLKTKYARENILNKYQNIDKTERAKREGLKEVATLIRPDVKLQALSLDAKMLTATLDVPNQATVARVIDQAMNKKLHAKQIDNKNTIEIESRL